MGNLFSRRLNQVQDQVQAPDGNPDFLTVYAGDEILLKHLEETTRTERYNRFDSTGIGMEPYSVHFILPIPLLKHEEHLSFEYKISHEPEEREEGEEKRKEFKVKAQGQWSLQHYDGIKKTRTLIPGKSLYEMTEKIHRSACEPATSPKTQDQEFLVAVWSYVNIGGASTPLPPRIGSGK